MIKTYTTEGIVIKRKKLGESDKLLTIFTQYLGKITVLAKGIRKIRSRRAAHLELFNRVTITVRHGTSLDLVVEAQVTESYGRLREDLTRVAYVYRMMEEIDCLCPEKQAHAEIFTLLTRALRQMNRTEEYDWAALTDEFSVRLLWGLGYLPPLRRLEGIQLRRYVESITERTLRSDRLIQKLLVSA